MTLLTFFLVMILSSVHLTIKLYKPFLEKPRKPFLSFSGGASVGYITVHLLPDFHKIQVEFNQSIPVPKRFEEYSLYIIATFGFLVFYSINYFVTKSKQKNTMKKYAFPIHIGAFIIYNSFIGYYLIKGLKQDYLSLVTFAIIFLLHLMVIDVGLHLGHNKRYSHWAQIILALSIVGGWIVGVFFTIPIYFYGIWFSWLAGGIILNTINEELPKERESKLLPFVLGVVISTTLLVLL